MGKKPLVFNEDQSKRVGLAEAFSLAPKPKMEKACRPFSEISTSNMKLIM